MNKKLFEIKSVAVALVFAISIAGCTAQKAAEKGWKNYTQLVKKIIPPTFANKDFSITDYGAKPIAFLRLTLQLRQVIKPEAEE